MRVWGAYIWRGLYMEGLIFGILRYLGSKFALTLGYLNPSSNNPALVVKGCVSWHVSYFLIKVVLRV